MPATPCPAADGDCTTYDIPCSLGQYILKPACAARTGPPARDAGFSILDLCIKLGYYDIYVLDGNMAVIPPFEPDGLLPPGDYEVSFDELRRSPLVLGPHDPAEYPSWDRPW